MPIVFLWCVTVPTALACRRLRTNVAVAVITFLLLTAASRAFDFSMNRLAIDYGPRLIGVAKANSFNSAAPLCTISNDRNVSALCLKLLTLAKTHDATELIVGVPLDKASTKFNAKNFNAQLVLNFAAVLSALHKKEQQQKIPGFDTPSIFLFDESFTTKEAIIRLKKQKQKGKVLLTDCFFLLLWYE